MRSNDKWRCYKNTEQKLKLKVNREKSAIGRPWQIKFLGFSFYRVKGEVRIRIHPKTLKRVKEKIKLISARSNGWPMKDRYLKLKQVLTGWVSYFRIADMKSIAKRLDEWTRCRIRMCYWKRWKRIKTRIRNTLVLRKDMHK